VHGVESASRLVPGPPVTRLARKRASDREPVMYHVVLKADRPDPAQETVESIRSRMGLLNSAMARVIRGALDYVVTLADYEQGCLELDVWTDRVMGIEQARVSVQVERVREPSQLQRAASARPA
jgi:hypothetical protein